MNETRIQPIELDLTLNSVQSEIEAAILCVRDRLGALPDRRDRFATELLCREALQNACEHGNQYDPNLHIHFTLTVRDDQFVCRISDEASPVSASIIRKTMNGIAIEASP